MLTKWIPKGEAGTRATLDEMKKLTEDSNRCSFVQPRQLDQYLRSRWQYVPDGDSELIRTVRRMFLDMALYGKFRGDCDDAAVMAGAMLTRYRTFRPAALRHATLVAVRPPHAASFEHVFAVGDDAFGSFRVDPTAPTDADYTHWEEMTVPIF